jgi:hypothetical protein
LLPTPASVSDVQMEISGIKLTNNRLVRAHVDASNTSLVIGNADCLRASTSVAVGAP